jgi:hypothetical protein
MLAYYNLVHTNTYISMPCMTVQIDSRIYVYACIYDVSHACTYKYIYTSAITSMCLCILECTCVHKSMHIMAITFMCLSLLLMYTTICIQPNHEWMCVFVFMWRTNMQLQRIRMAYLRQSKNTCMSI